MHTQELELQSADLVPHPKAKNQNYLPLSEVVRRCTFMYTYKSMCIFIHVWHVCVCLTCMCVFPYACINYCKKYLPLSEVVRRYTHMYKCKRIRIFIHVCVCLHMRVLIIVSSRKRIRNICHSHHNWGSVLGFPTVFQ